MLLLRLTRQHKIQVKCNPVPADLKSITDSALDITKGFLTNRDINFKIQREEAKISNVLADPARLRDVLVNILSNAAKFTPDGGTTVSYTHLCWIMTEILRIRTRVVINTCVITLC